MRRTLPYLSPEARENLSSNERAILKAIEALMEIRIDATDWSEYDKPSEAYESLMDWWFEHAPQWATRGY